MMVKMRQSIFFRFFKKLYHSIARHFYKVAPKLAWKIFQQHAEAFVHRHDEWRAGTDFDKDNAILLKYFGFNENDFSNAILFDLGSGSRLRTSFFRNAKIIAIEPLADRFIKESPGCNLKDAIAIISIPAEEIGDKLQNRADALISINVIDHCYDVELVIHNIYQVIKEGGFAFLII